MAETPELITVSSPEGHHFGTKTWPHPTACSLQCWDTSGQTTNRVGTQPHPSTNKLPKVVLNPQLPLNTLLDTACPPEGQNPALPTSGQAQVPPTRKPAQAPGPSSPTRGQTPEARGTTVLQSAEQRPQTQRVRQNETAEKYVPGKGTR